MLGKELMQYKERERRWIKREAAERTDFEAWKISAGASLLELADMNNFAKTFCLYEKVRKIGFLDSWEEAFVIFIEQEMDIRPGMLPGSLILDILDKLSLLSKDE